MSSGDEIVNSGSNLQTEAAPKGRLPTPVDWRCWEWAKLKLY
jgi:hypothetical protein